MPSAGGTARWPSRCSTRRLPGLPATAHLALHERLLRLAEAYIVMGQPDSADVMLDRAREEMTLMADSSGWELTFDTASDERLMKLMERVATAGRPVTAFRIQLLREARGGSGPGARYPVGFRSRAGAGTHRPGSLRRVAERAAGHAARGHARGTARGPLHISDSLATQVAHLWMALAAGFGCAPRCCRPLQPADPSAARAPAARHHPPGLRAGGPCAWSRSTCCRSRATAA